MEKKLLTLDFLDIFDLVGVVFGDVLLLPRIELEISTNLGSYLFAIGGVVTGTFPPSSFIG